MANWLTDVLKEKIKKVFEPRYDRQLNDLEVLEIAESLTSFLETTLKFRFEQNYEENIKQQLS